jgi:hypothetical protein
MIDPIEHAKKIEEARWRKMLADFPLLMARGAALRELNLRTSSPAAAGWTPDGEITSIELLDSETVRITARDPYWDTCIDDVPIECFWLDYGETFAVLCKNWKVKREQAEIVRLAEVERRAQQTEANDRAEYARLCEKLKLPNQLP